ncbi:MAG: hypothetical protein HDT46_08795 [Ruminococcaceae bacterium]|nr:hypothetical protein [Oscillospiraceae bacterium]
MSIIEFIRKHNIKSIVIQLAAFAVLFAVSKLFLDHVYLFNWTARQYYLYVWVIACLFSFFGKNTIGASITAGAVLGVPVAQLIGAYIRAVNMSKITEDTDPQREALLSNEPSWFIWIIIVLAAFIIGIAITVLRNIKRK